MLEEYRGVGTRNSVRGSAHRMTSEEGNVWSIGRAKGSEENILPLRDVEGSHNAIVVTRGVHVS